MREGDALTRIALVACLRSHAPDVSAWMLSAEPEVPFITSPRRPRIARLLAEAGVEVRTYHCETATVACKCRREAQLRAGDDMIHSVPGPRHDELLRDPLHDPADRRRMLRIIACRRAKIAAVETYLRPRIGRR